CACSHSSVTADAGQTKRTCLLKFWPCACAQNLRRAVGQNRVVRITAKVDYAVRAMVVLASRRSDAPIAADAIAQDQQIPLAFLIKILVDLRTAGLVISRRGASGGHLL